MYNMQHSYIYYTLVVCCMLGWMHDLVAAVCNECVQQLVDVSAVNVCTSVFCVVTADYLCIVL